MDLLHESWRWLKEAEYDPLAAADVVSAGRFNWACVVAQQAAEKAVKSLHIARGTDVERRHSVTTAIMICSSWLTICLPAIGLAREFSARIGPLG